MFTKILIANRGEIAVRIARTCRDLGVGTVAVYSDVDAEARHVRLADESRRLVGRSPSETYLNFEALLDAATTSGAQAVHPGYGFLSENADFAAAVLDAGLAWIGPPPDVTRRLGDKIEARTIARSAGVPVVPGGFEAVTDVDLVRAFADEHGYPVAIKAAGGGGGRGLRIARSEAEIDDAFAAARRESQSYFGSSAVYVERYLDSPKHLEVQLLAPNPDEALWLGVRDCSLQRRRQKLIEETPPPMWAERAPELGQAAVALSKASGYVNAGTAEFLVDAEGEPYFLEVNARLQVEHTVTEEVYGLDLVACQLLIAAGEPLGFSQADLDPRGHAIECRINAEDAARGFVPTPGRIERFDQPSGPGVRVDSGYGAGDEVPAEYDSLIAKVIVHASTRAEALDRMERVLDEMVVEGIATTIPAHRALLADDSFRAGTHTTATVETSGVLDALVAVDEPVPVSVLLVAGRAVHLWHPGMAASATAAVGAGASGDVVAPMQGTILKVLVSEGESVAAGDAVAILEAMKMETTLAAPGDGTVAEVRAVAGATVGSGEVVAVIR